MTLSTHFRAVCLHFIPPKNTNRNGNHMVEFSSRVERNHPLVRLFLQISVSVSELSILVHRWKRVENISMKNEEHSALRFSGSGCHSGTHRQNKHANVFSRAPLFGFPSDSPRHFQRQRLRDAWQTGALSSCSWHAPKSFVVVHALLLVLVESVFRQIFPLSLALRCSAGVGVGTVKTERVRSRPIFAAANSPLGISFVVVHILLCSSRNCRALWVFKASVRFGI